MPNNKKQRGRDNQKKKEAQKKAAQNALLGTPAIDEWINELAARSFSTTAKSPPAAVSKSSSTLSTEQEDGVVCYHGSSAEHFVADSDFLNLVKSYVVLLKKYEGVNDAQGHIAHAKFYGDTDNQSLYLDDDCPNFLFALAVSVYLKLTSADKERYRKLKTLGRHTIMEIGEVKKTSSYELETILKMGLTLKYLVIPQSKGEKIDEEQLRKYRRDVDSERGVINCLYRETSCDCMVTDKDRANDMDKMDLCHGCRKRFPKATTMVCDGCQTVVYCSEECCVNDWSRHQTYCTILQGRLDNGETKKKKKKTKKKKKKRAAATGTATSNANGSIATSNSATIVPDEGMDAPSMAANAAIHTVTATATSTVNAVATIDEAREKTAARKQRILENATKRMDYVKGEATCSISNAARIRATRQRRYDKKSAATVTPISKETTTTDKEKLDNKKKKK